MHAMLSPPRLHALVFAAAWRSSVRWPWAGARPATTRESRRRARSRSSRRRSGWIGRRATQQMIATNRATDGSISDATRSVEWLVRDPAIASVSSKGRVVPLARRDDRGHRPARQHRAGRGPDGRGHGSAGAGELPPRRDPRVQPGRVQHGSVPRHADRQGRIPAEPARLPARPGLRHPLAARPAAAGSTRWPPRPA